MKADGREHEHDPGEFAVPGTGPTMAGSRDNATDPPQVGRRPPVAGRPQPAGGGRAGYELSAVSYQLRYRRGGDGPINGLEDAPDVAFVAPAAPASVTSVVTLAPSSRSPSTTSVNVPSLAPIVTGTGRSWSLSLSLIHI